MNLHLAHTDQQHVVSPSAGHTRESLEGFLGAGRMASPTPRIWLKGSALSCIHQPLRSFWLKRQFRDFLAVQWLSLPANAGGHTRFTLNQEDLSHALGASKPHTGSHMQLQTSTGSIENLVQLEKKVHCFPHFPGFRK